jgi:hypothetical protein
MVLETKEERVRLLKSKYNGKYIEEKYIIDNKIHIVNLCTGKF